MTYRLLKNALDVSSLRQETISSNISNINTPDYKANRVVFKTHLNNAMQGVTLNPTNANHLTSSDTLGTVQKQTNTYTKENGNNVDIDFEMAELAANNIYYDSLVSQLNAKLKMMRNVIQ